MNELDGGREDRRKWADSGEIQERKLSRCGDEFDLYVRKTKVPWMNPRFLNCIIQQTMEPLTNKASMRAGSSFRRTDQPFIVFFGYNQFEDIYTTYLWFASRSMLYPSLYSLSVSTNNLTHQLLVSSVKEPWQVNREIRVKYLFHWLPLCEVELGCVLQKKVSFQYSLFFITFSWVPVTTPSYLSWLTALSLNVPLYLNPFGNKLSLDYPNQNASHVS